MALVAGVGMVLGSYASGAQDGDVIVLGQGADADQLPAAAEPLAEPTSGSSAGAEALGSSDFEIGLDRLWLETAAFTRSSSEAAGTLYAQGQVSARWRPSETWEWQAAGRLDSTLQTGARHSEGTRLDYGETFVRYRDDRRSITAGAQTVLWGRVDEVAPTDRLSVQDITRFILDELGERRRAVPMLRWEEFGDSTKLDVILIPEFRAAELPEQESVWYPVDQERGMVLGIPTGPLLQGLLAAGSVGDDARPGGAGGGVRFSQTLSGLDYALTLQRVRHSLPYYALDPQVRAALLGGASPQVAVAQGQGRPTFEGQHPYTTVVGGDLGLVLGSATLRLEAAWLSDVPVTTEALQMETVNGVDWVAGVELYPGDADTRLNLQLMGHHLMNPPRVLDQVDVISLNGQLETEWGQGRWRARLNMVADLNHDNLYLNPEVVWTGIRSLEIYAGLHYFAGENGTFGDYFSDNTNVALGWRMSF
ncbi:MAG: hypothetical protein K9L88_20540 [Chromatiaceae bacterium]|nr:hypothetical protein [Chromatiaceae bacterium]